LTFQVEADEISQFELHLIFEQLNPFRIRMKSQQGGLERVEDRFDKTGLPLRRRETMIFGAGRFLQPE
jgi:hypothetical protein